MASKQFTISQILQGNIFSLFEYQSYIERIKGCLILQLYIGPILDDYWTKIGQILEIYK